MATQPSANDQYMLELLNRTRANPQDEVDRYPNSSLGGDLNEGLAPGTISSDPVQPLAWNLSLIDAAAGHSQYLLDNNLFTHRGDGGTSSRDRARAEGYPRNGGVGENIAWIGTTGFANETTFTRKNHENLFIDENYRGRGHRINILKSEYAEVGISNISGPFTSGGTTFNAVMSTQDFGYVPGANSFLTGVVYTDGIVDDDFYTVGEGLGGITVEATNTSNQTFSFTTWDAGGYQIQLDAGIYDVSFIGDFDTDGDIDTVTQSVTIGSQNVKLDFTTDTFVECFLTGTRILTDRGEISVETLQQGDRVLTADGKLESVKWIGQQTIDPEQVHHPLRSCPILIKAGALGNGLPHRDLYTSPDHAFLFQGLLINAGALVNDVSILKTNPTETFTYYHVELHQHSLLVAEGAAAESYLPQRENRDWYDNGNEYAALYPHDGIFAYWPMKYPRVSSKRQLPRYVRKELMAIAQFLKVERAA